MIVNLLSKNLKVVKDETFSKKPFSARSWARIGIQCLYGIKVGSTATRPVSDVSRRVHIVYTRVQVVHDSGFVHRDLKTANFMMGNAGNRLHARVVYILDFGLARFA